jgi:galactonate dehydratase
MYRCFHFRGAAIMGAISAIDIALWDIAGKYFGVPVYQLLGGKCRDKIQVYANGWYSGKVSDQEIAERAKSMVKRGFMAMKFDPFPGPWRSFISVNEEDQAIERIKVIRDAVGPDIGLLVEAHRRLSPNNAIRFAKRLEPLNPYWFEEPTDCQNIDEMAQVAARTDLVLVMGEALYNKVEFIDVFTKHAASVVNPDVCNCGILELKEIAAMAEAFSVMVSPHNFNSTASGTAATIQVSACIPNFRITEYFVSFEEVGNRLCVSPLPLQDGYILLDDSRPGLGVELIEEELLRNPGREFPIRPFRQYYEEP